MKREERKIILSWSKYIAFFIATLFVVFFQIWGHAVFVVISLALYTAAFSIITLAEIENFIYISNTKIEGETQEEIEKKTKELKDKKIFSISKFVLSGVFALFTLVVLIYF